MCASSVIWCMASPLSLLYVNLFVGEVACALYAYELPVLQGEILATRIFYKNIYVYVLF